MVSKVKKNLGWILEEGEIRTNYDPPRPMSVAGAVVLPTKRSPTYRFKK